MKNIAILASLFMAACGSAKVEKVLVIGDSISMGYMQPTQELLAGEFELTHPDENCKNSTYTRSRLETWLAQNPEATTITWNNGIWNATVDEESEHFEWYATPIEQYRDDILFIARRLKQTGARVIFFTTTPPDGDTSVDAELIDLQNAVAKEVLPAEGIEIYDLNQWVKDKSPEHRSPGNLHYSEDGSKILAEFVASAIKGI